MATKESLGESSDPIKYKRSVLRVSIHCEACKKKVKKILSQVPGVLEIDIDITQQKVTVTGDVDVVTLLRKLKKSGKHADLWPEKESDHETEKKPGKTKEQKQPKQDANKETAQKTVASNNKDKAAIKSSEQPVNDAQAPKEPTKNNPLGGGVAKSGEENGGISAPKVGEESLKAGTNEDVSKELKSERSKAETIPAGAEPPVAVETKSGDCEDATGEEVGGGNNGKKKKKKGQNGNATVGESSSVSEPAADHAAVPPSYSISANHVLARGQNYYGDHPDLYNAPPVYAASYNMSYPSSATTASYYTPPPANSYVYAYSAPEMEPPPSDVRPYARQPLDSFEMFSDENPNGCSII